MDVGWATFLGAVVGGVAALVGGWLNATMAARAARRQGERDFNAKCLVALEDVAARTFTDTLKIWQQAHPSGLARADLKWPSLVHDPAATDVKKDIVALESLTSRVQSTNIADQAVKYCVALDNFFRAKSPDEAGAALEEAENLLHGLQGSIGRELRKLWGDDPAARAAALAQS